MTQEEFKIHVFPLQNKLFRLAKRLLENIEEAEDIVQEVFIKLWNMKDKLGKYRSIEALAVVTTRNLCLDRLRAKKYTTGTIDTLQDEMEYMMGEQKNDQEEIMDRIHQIIKSLPDQQKTILHLRDIEGYDYEEIAAILDMNENAVRVNVSRARKKIREIISQQDIYEYRRN